VLQRAGVRVSVAPTQIGALLLSMTGPSVTIVSASEAAALARLPVQVLQQFMAALHGVAILRKKSRQTAPVRASGWPSWAACEQAFDVLRRWGLKTLGEFAALPAADLSARMGQAGVALQQLARGVDPRPLVPDPDVPRFVERIELEWPLDGLEPLSFVLARLLDPLSTALERADRAAAAVRLDLRLVDRSSHVRVLQLPAALRDPRVLRTLLLLDLESHPPTAAIDVVTIEIDPAPGRVIQYSLLERALPSVEMLATLTARLSALVGESRCGRPVLLDTHQPDAFEMHRFDGTTVLARVGPPQRELDRSGVMPCIRRFRPPVAVRVAIDCGRPAHVAIDRRGMPGGHVVQAAGPWRSSGAWWTHDGPWDRDEWDIELSDGSVCRLFRERLDGGWFIEGVVD
jgi:protein ImuB